MDFNYVSNSIDNNEMIAEYQLSVFKDWGVLQLLHQVNTTLIEIYRWVGEYISNKIASSMWGDGVVKQLAAYISHNVPDLKGFSDKNL